MVKCKALTVVGRGLILCDPRSELLEQEADNKGEDNKWDGEKKKNKVVLAQGRPIFFPTPHVELY